MEFKERILQGIQGNKNSSSEPSIRSNNKFGKELDLILSKKKGSEVMLHTNQCRWYYYHTVVKIRVLRG